MSTGTNDPVLCSICHQAVLDGQPMNAHSGNHWDCDNAHVDALRQLDEFALVAVDLARGKSKRRVKPGDGRVGNKLKAKLIRFFETQYGSPITEFKYWIQDVSDRGPRMDLANWGGAAKAGTRDIYFSSWHTMTECAAGAELDVTKDGLIAWCVGPARSASACDT